MKKIVSFVIVAVMLFVMVPFSVSAKTEKFENVGYETEYEYTGQAIPTPTASDFGVTGDVVFEWAKFDFELMPDFMGESFTNPPVNAGIYVLTAKYLDKELQEAVIITPLELTLTSGDSDNNPETCEYYATSADIPDPVAEGYKNGDTFENTQTKLIWACVDENDNVIEGKPVLPGKYRVVIAAESENYYGLCEDYIEIGAPTDTVIIGNNPKEYDGSAKGADLAVPDTWVEGTDYTVSYFDADNAPVTPVDAGDYKIVVDIVGKDSVEGSFTVKPCTLYISDCVVKDKIYDGDDTAEIKSISFARLDSEGEAIPVDVSTDEYEAIAGFENADAGKNKLAIVIAKIDKKNYTSSLLTTMYLTEATIGCAEPTFNGGQYPTVSDVEVYDRLGDCAITGGQMMDINGNALEGEFKWVAPDHVFDTPNFIEEFEIFFIPKDKNYCVISFYTPVKTKPLCDGTDNCITTRYTDLDSDKWYHEYTDCVLRRGLMDGVGNNKFAPDTVATRAMVVTILWRLEGKTAPSELSEFKDVEQGKWYTDAVNWAAENEIVKGYDTGLFGTNDSITREQLATMLYRYAKYKKSYTVSKTKSTSGFTDAKSIGSWAVEAMDWAYANDIITGVGTELQPKGNATRIQLATVLTRISGKI